MPETFITSDTHFGHTNICRGVSQWNDKTRCRDFETVHEMNSFMTEQINKTVKEDDILYHLGDFAFGGGKQVHEYINHINCKHIILILGNHDQRYKKLYRDRFEDVCMSAVLFMDKIGISLQHYPYKPEWLEEVKKVGYQTINLHGHTHCYNGIFHDEQMDVSVEGNDYKPWHVEEIMRMFKNKENIL